MDDDNGILKIVTIGRHFPLHPEKLGIWAAELLWTDDDQRPVMDQKKDQCNGSNNVALEVYAALQGLRHAADLGLPVEIRSGNESIVRTMLEWAPNWKARGWTKKGGGTIASLAEWQEIDALCSDLQVKWVKRAKEDIDHINDFNQLWQALEDRENHHLMSRAIARDPYS